MWPFCWHTSTSNPFFLRATRIPVYQRSARVHEWESRRERKFVRARVCESVCKIQIYKHLRQTETHTYAHTSRTWSRVLIVFKRHFLAHVLTFVFSQLPGPFRHFSLFFPLLNRLFVVVFCSCCLLCWWWLFVSSCCCLAVFYLKLYLIRLMFELLLLLQLLLFSLTYFGPFGSLFLPWLENSIILSLCQYEVKKIDAREFLWSINHACYQCVPDSGSTEFLAFSLCKFCKPIIMGFHACPLLLPPIHCSHIQV